MKRFALFVVALVAFGAVAPHAQSPVAGVSPIIGQWKTDVEKSNYFPGPRPAAAGYVGGRNYIDRGNGQVAEVRMNVNALGQPALINIWTGKLDGKEASVYAAVGGADLLAFLENGTKPMPVRSYKVLDNGTIEAVNKAGMVVNNSAVLAVSKDGKTMTETIKNFNAMGQQVGQNIIVYERQ